MSKSLIRRLGLAVVLTTFGLLLAIGCQSGDESPVATFQSDSIEIGTPVPNLDDPFFEDVWETVYNTPFSLVDGNVSWTYVDDEVDAIGQYGGVNNSGEPFTLDVQDILYLDTTQLAALDPDNATLYAQFNVTLAYVFGTYGGPAGSLVLEGCVRSYDTTGGREHYYFPSDYDTGILRVDIIQLSGGAPKLETLLGGRVFNKACDGSWENCNQNSPRPEKPDFQCPTGQSMDSDCEDQCSEEFDSDIDDAINDGCTALCQAWEAYQGAITDCKIGAGVALAAAALIPGAPLAAVVAGDAVTVGLYGYCVNAAGDAYGTSVDQAQAAYTQEVNQAKSDYESCAEDCCEDDLIPIEKGYRMIGG